LRSYFTLPSHNYGVLVAEANDPWFSEDCIPWHGIGDARQEIETVVRQRDFPVHIRVLPSTFSRCP